MGEFKYVFYGMATAVVLALLLIFCIPLVGHAACWWDARLAEFFGTR